MVSRFIAYFLFIYLFLNEYLINFEGNTYIDAVILMTIWSTLKGIHILMLLCWWLFDQLWREYIYWCCYIDDYLINFEGNTYIDAVILMTIWSTLKGIHILMLLYWWLFDQLWRVYIYWCCYIDDYLINFEGNTYIDVVMLMTIWSTLKGIHILMLLYWWLFDQLWRECIYWCCYIDDYLINFEGNTYIDAVILMTIWSTLKGIHILMLLCWWLFDQLWREYIYWCCYVDDYLINFEGNTYIDAVILMTIWSTLKGIHILMLLCWWLFDQLWREYIYWCCYVDDYLINLEGNTYIDAVILMTVWSTLKGIHILMLLCWWLFDQLWREYIYWCCYVDDYLINFEGNTYIDAVILMTIWSTLKGIHILMLLCWWLFDQLWREYIYWCCYIDDYLINFEGNTYIDAVLNLFSILYNYFNPQSSTNIFHWEKKKKKYFNVISVSLSTPTYIIWLLVKLLTHFSIISLQNCFNMYMYMYIHVHKHLHVLTGATYDRMCKHLYMQVCMGVYTCICICIYSNLFSLGNSHLLCNRKCTAKYSPVCSNNGVTYNNFCQLSIARCKKSLITFAYKGKCTIKTSTGKYAIT